MWSVKMDGNATAALDTSVHEVRIATKPSQTTKRRVPKQLNICESLRAGREPINLEPRSRSITDIQSLCLLWLN